MAASACASSGAHQLLSNSHQASLGEKELSKLLGDDARQGLKKDSVALLGEIIAEQVAKMAREPGCKADVKNKTKRFCARG